MARVYISIGSNIDRERHIRAAITALRQRYGEVAFSPVYESVAVGFDGDDFYNLVAAFDTDASVDGVADALATIEVENGRDRSGPRFSSRTLDLDLLLYDDLVIDTPGLKLPRAEISHNAFVLLPLADLAPEAIHPELNQSFAEMWARFDKESQRLWRVDFNFA